MPALSVWGFEFLAALYHHRSVGVVRTPNHDSCFVPGVSSYTASVTIDYTVTVDRVCCSFGFGGTVLAWGKRQVFCGRALGLCQRDTNPQTSYRMSIAYPLGEAGLSLQL